MTSTTDSDWWSQKRRRYNVGLVVSGSIAFILYVAIAWVWEERLPCVEITAFTVAFGGVAYLIVIGLANIFYYLGPLAEFVLNPADPMILRQRLYALGFWLSVSLPFLVPLLVALSAFGPPASCDNV